MRTRIRTEAQHHAGRRRSVARRPPDEELVLRLQRTIGNRATVQLLRAPKVLATAGVKTDARVSDKTPGLIQAAVEESDELKPFLKGKFPKSAITKDFTIHADEDDFNVAVKRIQNNKDLMDKRKRAEAYGHIGGIFDRSTRQIHVRSRTKFGHAVHEAMHRLASPSFRGFWGDFINEGVTQLFTDRLLVEHGLTEVTDHEYKDQLACAKKLVALTDVKTVAAAYFQGDQKLLAAAAKKLNTDANGFHDALAAGTACARL